MVRLPPSSRRVNHPEPEPHIGSTRTFLLGGPDPLEVDDARELVAEARVGVEDLDQSRGDRIVVLASGRNLVLRVPIHGGLDGGQHGRRRRAAGIGLDLEPVVGPRVVAGGDDDARRRRRAHG